MARIFVDKYGRETTEGPQEGVIGSATGTHSSAGLTGDNSAQTWVQGPPQMGPLQGPGQGPGHWENQGMNLDPFSGHFNADPTHSERKWVQDVANRWYRDDNGQWQNSGQVQQGMVPGPMQLQRPMTVQQQQARAMAGLPALGAPQPQAQNPQSDWQRYLMNQVWGKPLGS